MAAAANAVPLDMLHNRIFKLSGADGFCFSGLLWGKDYQYRFLPYQLALLPCIFTKCMDEAPLQLDNWLILAYSEKLVAQQQDVMLANIDCLGLRLNLEKSVLSLTQYRTENTPFSGMHSRSLSEQEPNCPP